MKDLTKDEKLDKIFEAIESRNITAYEISKSTGLNESGLIRLIKKEVSNPHTATIDKLYSYLYSDNTVVNINDNIKSIDNLQDLGDFVAENFNDVRKASRLFDLTVENESQEYLIKKLTQHGVKFQK